MLFRSKSLGRKSYELSDAAKKSKIFTRSLFVVKDTVAGELFTNENVRSIRPGNGLHPKFLHEILGKRSKNSVPRGTPLSWEDIQT